jgi:predicted RNA-binding protein with PUA-like domain
MNYWLVKSEPGAWSWDDHVKKEVEPWDGVRNYQQYEGDETRR